MTQSQIVNVIYPVDYTGTAVSNRIANEPHTISEINGDNYRLIVPEKSPFYDTNFILVHQGSGKILDRGTDYEFGHVYRDMSLHINKVVYGSIMILNPKLSGNFTISYNTLGGEFIQATRELTRVAAELLYNPRQVTLDDIVDMPAKLPPRDHGHNAKTDIVGMDDVVTVLETIVTVISGNPAIAHHHDMADVRGLVDALKRKAPSNHSHKTSPTAGFRLVGYKGSAVITLPKFAVNTRIRCKIVIMEANASSEIYVEGVVGGLDVAVYRGNWPRGKANIIGTLPVNKISFSYDISKNPSIYLGEQTTFADTFITLTDITLDNDSPDLYIDGYGCGGNAIIVGTPVDITRGLSVPA